MPPIATPRVSVCVPYWNRRVALEQMLDDLQDKYGGDERWLEVSICDDGSGRVDQSLAAVLIDNGAGPIASNFIPNRWPFMSIRLATLPAHDAPRCSALAINVAVESSTAPVVVIQNPETTHRDARVLLEIERALAVEPTGYVVASCWDSLTKQWYEHPTHRPKKMHWCVGMRRELWRKAGGIDLGLMAGHCYEDNDLRNRIHEAGAKFIAREDLVVEHHKQFQEKYVGRIGRADQWDQTLVAVNRSRYTRSWESYWADLGGDGE